MSIAAPERREVRRSGYAEGSLLHEQLQREAEENEAAAVLAAETDERNRARIAEAQAVLEGGALDALRTSQGEVATAMRTYVELVERAQEVRATVNKAYSTLRNLDAAPDEPMPPTLALRAAVYTNSPSLTADDETLRQTMDKFRLLAITGSDI